jgi:hypothetical protein
VNVYDNSYYNNSSYNYNTYPTYVQPTVIQQPTYVSSNSSGLDIGCYADPTTAYVDQPVTWNVEVTGGAAPYTYSWTGSDGLNSSQVSALMYYTTTGSKSAIVTVTSADGRTGVRACSNTVTVRRQGSGNVAPTQVQTAPVQQAPAQQPAQNQSNGTNGLGASAAFSLSNVPWGWVSVLVILVLFGTVMYLLFNRPKI